MPADVEGVPVDVEGLRVVRDRRVILSGIDLHVPAGSWLTLIGPNGAGKTTLLHALASVISYEGEVHFAGQAVGHFDRRRRARTVALVPQTPAIPPGMAVTQYVSLGRTAHLPLYGTETVTDHAVVAHLLDSLELAELADRPLVSLSGGERQRAVLARALAQEAGVLLLDEPTTGLDLGRQQQVLDLVADLQAQRSLTVISTMHDLVLAGQYAKHVALLGDGRLVAQGPPAAILTRETLVPWYGQRIRVLHSDGLTLVVPAGPDTSPP